MFREGVRELVVDRRECGSTQVEPGVRGSPGRPDGMLCDEDNWPEAATKMSPGLISDLRSAPPGRRRTSAEEGQPTDTHEKHCRSPWSTAARSHSSPASRCRTRQAFVST